MVSIYSSPCELSNTVTITTGGVPLGTCRVFFGPDLELPEKRYRRKSTATPKSAMVRNLPLRRTGMREERGLKAGGFDAFRGGYAKCILKSLPF